jgi:hypothetical protein
VVHEDINLLHEVINNMNSIQIPLQAIRRESRSSVFTVAVVIDRKPEGKRLLGRPRCTWEEKLK